MLAWTIAFFCTYQSFHLFAQELKGTGIFFSFKRQQRNLLKVIGSLQEFEELLMAGLVPSIQNWDVLKSFDHPWRKLTYDSLKELRDRGGALLPTLKRLKDLAETHRTALEEARAKASQAFAQAMVCTFFVPILGLALYLLLPGVQQSSEVWGGACFCALIVASFGSIWLMKMVNSARWGGLRNEQRSWVLAAQCAGERFLALIRVGTPPDLAWVSACQFLMRDEPRLSFAWGNSIWEYPKVKSQCRAEDLIVGVASSIKKSIQVSLMEGRPCLERVEATLLSFRQDMNAEIARELMVLPTRALKPLFIFVAPSLFGLLACGLWLAGINSIGFE